MTGEPCRSDRTSRRCQEPQACSIERFINKIKHCRRIATRYDRLAANTSRTFSLHRSDCGYALMSPRPKDRRFIRCNGAAGCAVTWLLRIVGALNSAHIFGTLVPVEEPSTASNPDSCTAASVLVMDGPERLAHPRRDRDRRLPRRECGRRGSQRGCSGCRWGSSRGRRSGGTWVRRTRTRRGRHGCCRSRVSTSCHPLVRRYSCCGRSPRPTHTRCQPCHRGRTRWGRMNQPAPVCFPSHWLPQPVAVGISLADFVTPGISRLRSRARRVFVFRLGEQPVGLAGHPGQPCHVALGVIPSPR